MTLNILIKKKQLEYIAKFVKENCPHEWEIDNIDLYPKKKVYIKYCKYLLTNKT